MGDPSPSATTPRGLMRPSQVQDELNISRSTLMRYVASGVLPELRLPGGHRRFRRTDVERLIRGAEAAPTAVAG